ncbi:MAG TPA: hypothetical protein VFD43_04980 [Planctomycetota bacterium]|nr:hypothetical protein [Planctomycetota bacterium]
MALGQGDETRTLDVAGLDALDQHVQELTRELQSLRTSPALRAAGADPAPTSAVEPLRASADADVKSLIARLDALLDQQALARAAEAAGGTAPLVIPDPAATETARRALIDAGREKVPSDNYLMTYQQIVERYGRPTLIRPDDGGVVVWTYADRDNLNSGVNFRFVDGLVSGWN